MGKRVGIYLVGLAINALEIALIIFSAAGAGAWDTVAIGLNNSWGIPIEYVRLLYKICHLGGWYHRKKKASYESIIAIIIWSIFLDAWIYLVFNHIDQAASWEFQWLYFIVGIISMGIGIGIYVEAHFPKSPSTSWNSLSWLFLYNRFKWSIEYF